MARSLFWLDHLWPFALGIVAGLVGLWWNDDWRYGLVIAGAFTASALKARWMLERSNEEIRKEVEARRLAEKAPKPVDLPRRR